MGNSSGKHSSACKEALSALDSNEVETLEQQFRAAAGRKAPQDRLDADSLGQALGLSSPALAQGLFRAMQSVSGCAKDAMPFDDFAVAVTKCCTSQRYERRSFWILAVGGHEGGSASRDMLRAVVEEEVARGLPPGASYGLRDKIVSETVAAAFEGKGGSLACEEAEKWLMANEGTEGFFADLVGGCFLKAAGGASRPKTQMPTLSRPSAMLREEHLWTLARQMPPHCLEAPWKVLYNSSKHGKSFARFVSKIIFKGPTVIVIRDKGGAAFGMFSAVSWRRHNKFYGESTSLVFSLTPKCSVYRSSGVNQNFQFLATNLTASASCANGLGMGGQMDFWGVHLDDHLEEGVCRAPCSTFSDMPCLSSDAKFQVDAVEVWGCLPGYVADERELEAAGVKKKKARTWEEYERQRAGKTCLEGDVEAQAVLEAAGRTNYSADVRAADALMEKEKAALGRGAQGGDSDSDDEEYEYE
mmetsp:Transcript_26690/g.67330  ORF Transcript_26690/g.67330 Transcript_26690/m.67330 type:complete len:472 (-) Transcript_26690:4-1419(-)